MKLYRNKYSIAMMSRVLGVSNSGFYKWLKTNPLKAQKSASLDAQIKKVFNNSRQTYGSPRVALALKEQQVRCSKTTVARKMKALYLVARSKRKFVSTTDSAHGHKISENLLDRQFTVNEVNTVWVSDITYIRVANRWMYLTTMIDLADRMVVGWSLSKNMSTSDTVNQAFKIAVSNRGITKNSNLMIHSDRGVQYASREFRSLLSKYNCIQSMSRKGNCWDNAVAESFFKTIKIEALNRKRFLDEHSLKGAVFRYIDGWYNTVRIHSYLGGKSPLQVYKMKSIKLAA